MHNHYARRLARLATGRVRLGLLLAATALVAAGGCQSWPFARPEKTSLITPAMRMAAIRETAARGRQADLDAQLEVCQQLANQIRTEPDPIVRKAIQESIAELQHPLAGDVLAAGLNDDDREVRLVCCRHLGRRGEATAIAALRRIAAGDPDIDVRLEAVDALGGFKTPESVRALATAVNDRDPAMQYAGVRAMRSASGEDLGNDVEAWRQYVASLPAASSEDASSIATENNGASSFR